MTLSQKTILITLSPSALLLIPLIAMFFSAEVQWSLADFVVAGILLTGTGYLVSLVLRASINQMSRWLLIAGIVLMLLLVWAELAVGIFGTPFAGS